MNNTRRFILLFMFGFSFGELISFLCVFVRTRARVTESIDSSVKSNWNRTEFTDVVPAGGILQRVTTNLDELSFIDSHLHEDDASVADRLYQTVRILCLVMTYPENHRKKAIHVNATWGKRCNKLLFVTRTADEKLPTLILNVKDGRSHLGDKTRVTFDHAYKYYLADYDWFLKADDDTYVIMENLRYFLSAQDHNLPVFFGQKFGKHTPQGYPSGGAGYVASREALNRYGQRSNQTPGCRFNSGAEDIDFGRCMQSVGVTFGDSLDALGRTRFHCFTTAYHIRGAYSDWYNRYDKQNGRKKGLDGLSDYAISFHYVKPNDMYLMEYFVYHLNPYGIINGLQNINSNVTAA